MKEEVKELWKLCFPEDSEEFVNMYFSLRYTDNITSTIAIDGKIASSLQRIPYTMSYKKNIIPVAYISGACTQPERRSMGLMTRLLKEAHRKMFSEGKLMSILIPANESLVTFYANSSYIIGFTQKEELFVKTIRTGKHYSFIKLNILKENDIEDIYKFIYRLQSQRPSCILHDFNDMKVIISDLTIAEGEIWKGYSSDGTLSSVAFVIKEKDKLYIKELEATDCDSKEGIINFLIGQYNTDCAHFACPCGMARVINAYKLLEIYSHFIYKKLLVEVYGDDAISENNGFYLLSDGKCTKVTGFSEDDNNTEHLRLDITQLMIFLLKGENPYMNLMLN